jgi:hypothetical protein
VTFGYFLSATALALVMGAGVGGTPPEIRPFNAADGCTLFPDGEYFGCCLVHDFAYWAGGTAGERSAADREMRACIRDIARGRTRAVVMWTGVRIFGLAEFPTGFRWGHGWPYFYRTNSAPLTPAQREQVDRARRGVCDSLIPDAATGGYAVGGDRFVRAEEQRQLCAGVASPVR